MMKAASVVAVALFGLSVFSPMRGPPRVCAWFSALAIVPK